MIDHDWFLKIVEGTKRGAKEALSDIFAFSEIENIVGTEYLLTVNVAKSISEINPGVGFPLKVFLEKNRSEFSIDASTTRRFVSPRERPKTCQPFYPESPRTRTDIGVYIDDNNKTKPFCTIELKGYQPPRNRIVKDFKRIIELISFNTDFGVSNIQYGLFGAYGPQKNSRSKKSPIEAEKSRYCNILQDLNLPANLKAEVETKVLQDEAENQSLIVFSIVTFTRE